MIWTRRASALPPGELAGTAYAITKSPPPARCSAFATCSRNRLCAPHGLGADNCVIYTSAADLNMQLQTMGIDHYTNLLAARHAWLQRHTTERAAAHLLQESAS